MNLSCQLRYSKDHPSIHHARSFILHPATSMKHRPGSSHYLTRNSPNHSFVMDPDQIFTDTQLKDAHRWYRCTNCTVSVNVHVIRGGMFLPNTPKNFIGSTYFTVIGNFRDPKCLIWHSFVFWTFSFCEAIMISTAEAPHPSS